MITFEFVDLKKTSLNFLSSNFKLSKIEKDDNNDKYTFMCEKCNSIAEIVDVKLLNNKTIYYRVALKIFELRNCSFEHFADLVNVTGVRSEIDVRIDNFVVLEFSLNSFRAKEYFEILDKAKEVVAKVEREFSKKVREIVKFVISSDVYLVLDIGRFIVKLRLYCIDNKVTDVYNILKLIDEVRNYLESELMSAIVTEVI